jgi:hypothetical protein
MKSKKFTFTIMWNSRGFHASDGLRKDAKMARGYFVTKILSPLEHAIFPRGREPHQEQLGVHFDHYPVYTNRASTNWFEEYDMRSMPHAPYSSDLLTIDFYLFPTVKEKLKRIQVADEEQFFECLPEILKCMDQEKLNGVFQA